MKLARDNLLGAFSMPFSGNFNGERSFFFRREGDNYGAGMNISYFRRGVVPGGDGRDLKKCFCHYPTGDIVIG